jgi:uncharacterized protein YoxC
MFNQSQRALAVDKALAGLTAQVETLTQALADMTARCAALEAQREEDAERLEDMGKAVASLIKRVDWEAQQVHHTAAALMEKISQKGVLF